MTLLSRSLIRVGDSSLPLSALATLGVILKAALVLTVTGILASFDWAF
jgi:hypothetical protein